MTRIGILTYYRSLNPGVFWQAYATFRAFTRLHVGARVEMIRLYRGVPILPTHSYRRAAAPLWDITRWRKFHRSGVAMCFSEQACRSTDFKRATEFLCAMNYDLISVGSDTCLELCHAPADGISPYWLSPSLRCRKMLCAASARDTSYERVSEAQRCLLRESVADFQLLGVRDNATANLLRRLTAEQDPRIEIVPDPTFYVEVDTKPAARYLEAKGVELGRRSVLLHLPPGLSCNSAIVAAFRQHGFQVLSLSPLHKADYTLFDLSPVEWAGIFRFVVATVTYRFHDSVFSLKQGTPVLGLIPGPDYVAANGDSKYQSLFREFGIHSSCLIKNWMTLGPGDITDLVADVLVHWQKEPVVARSLELGRSYLDYVRKSVNLLS